MAEIITLLQSLSQTVTITELGQLRVIVPAVVAMTGQITMLNLVRWTGKGGSYRTIRRFYHAPIVWLKVNWALTQAQLREVDGIFLRGGDETVVTKAGKHTFGLDRFFSSIYQKSVPGLSFFGVSVISVEEQQSTMLLLEQLTKAESTSKKAPKPQQKSKRRNINQNRKVGVPREARIKTDATLSYRLICKKFRGICNRSWT